MRSRRLIACHRAPIPWEAVEASELYGSAEMARQSGDVDEAVHLFDALARKLAEGDCDQRILAEVARDTANTLADVGRAAAALPYYAKARDLAGGDEALLALITIDEAILQAAEGSPREAAGVITELLASTRVPDEFLGHAYRTLGQILRDSGDPLGAAQALNAAIESANASDDVEELGHAFYSLAYTQLSVDDLDAAADLFRTAQEVYGRLDDGRYEARCLDGIGCVLAFRGLFREALALHAAAYAGFARDFNQASQAIVLVNQGWAMLNCGQPQRSLELYEEAMAWRRDYGQPSDVRGLELCMVAPLCELGRLEDAKELLDRVEAARAPSDPPEQVALALWMRGWLLACEGNVAESAEIRRRAGDSYLAIGQFALARETAIYPPAGGRSTDAKSLLT